MDLPPLVQLIVNDAIADIDEEEKELLKCWDMMNGGTIVPSKDLMACGMFWQHERKIARLEEEIARIYAKFRNSKEPNITDYFDDDIPF